MRVYLETYGCQMNEADSELALGVLEKKGYQRTLDIAEADVVLVNTCAVRQHAEERVLGRLGYFSTFKSRKPNMVIGVLGCMGQHLKERLLALSHGGGVVDLVVGPDGYRRLPELIERARGGDPFVDIRLDRNELYSDLEPLRAQGVRAWVPIMRGCNRFCTFCIVPLVRGRERCLPVTAVLDQVKKCVEAGFREIVFLGQTVNSYRDEESDFADLLRLTNEIDGVERIRFTSPHPADMSDEVINAMAECEKVMPQLHLPLQSASNSVLEHMKRGYTIEQFDEIVGKLRHRVPGIALGTDIIVGFHNESEQDFLATYEYLERTRFDSAFMFKYSRREGTRSYRWGDTVPEEEKNRRLQAIIQLQEKISAEINQGWIGKTVEVLVEGRSKKGEGQLSGKSPQFKTVVFPDDGSACGDKVMVRITEATAHTLIGEHSFGDSKQRGNDMNKEV